MNKLEIKNWVEKNPRLVKMRESDAYPGLFVLKYTKRVFYDDLWNRFLEECRGTVVDADFNVISRPFTKVYNYGVEKNAPKLKDDVEVDAYRKINGFMVAVTWHDGDILVSTTGSLDSDFCKMAREMMDICTYRSICSKYPDLTFMFECVHKNDPHIIPEQEGMYLIGYREKAWNSPVKIDPLLLAVLGIEFGALPVLGFRTTVGEVIALTKTNKTEGFVFYTDDGLSSKIKSPYYLFKKFLARKTPEKLIVILKDNTFKNLVDEEFYPICEYLHANLEMFVGLSEQDRLTFIRQYIFNSV